MRYSLLHRFQGTFIGSLIGANLRHPGKSNPWWLSLSQEMMKRLAQTGELSPEDWSVIPPQKFPGSDDCDWPHTGELILGTLPLIVFFHDAPSLLGEQLNTLAIKWQLPPEQLEEIMVFSQLIALILPEKLNIKDIIPQLLTEHNLPDSRLSQSLEQVGSFWQRETPLRQVTAHFARQMPLEQSALALAIYCFGRTPEDFSVGVLSASQTHSSIITALVGALAGAYNSGCGIPPHWHLGMKTTENRQLIEQTLPQLWAMWTGVNSLVNIERYLNLSAVNSPLVMQKRSSVRLISQKEFLRQSPLPHINSTVVKEVND